MKKRNLLVLLLSMAMVMTSVMCSFAESGADDNSAGEVVVTEEQATVEAPAAEEPVAEEPAKDVPEEQPALRGGKTGWYQEDGYYYYYEGGVIKTGWLKWNGYWYYLDPDEDGAMLADDWKEIKGYWYYFLSSGKMKTGWFGDKYTYDGVTYTDWYYFNSSGHQLFGWQKISGKWYFFPESWDGIMATGAAYDSDNEKIYLFANNGVWRSGFTGWYSQSYTEEDGTKGTDWFYFKKGAGIDGWQKISGSWYYFWGGWMAANEWAYDKSGAYWMGSNGKITKNKWIYDEYYYYDEEEDEYEGAWFYVGSNGHPVCNKWMKDSKGWCYLNEDGVMVTNGWAKDSKGYCYIGEKGYMVEETKWIEYEDDWYYIQKGYRVENKTIMIDGEEYTFDEDGICENPPF